MVYVTFIGDSVFVVMMPMENYPSFQFTFNCPFRRTNLVCVSRKKKKRKKKSTVQASV